MKKLTFISFSLFVSISLFFSCTKINNIEINDIGNYPQPLFEPLPIKVGVYYGNDFATFETTQKVKIPNTDLTYIDHVKMGKANTVLFDTILPMVFEKVTHVLYLPKGSDHMRNVDLIIEPAVHSYSIPNPTADGVYIHIVYDINFYLPEGEKISSWRIEGTGHALIQIEFKTEVTAVTELTQMAMRQVAAKFMTDFCKQADIKKLFYKECSQ
jgi:hypothetical protein